jgi:hypothetical protein
MKVMVIASVTYCCELSGEDQQRIEEMMELEENQDRSIEDIVMELYQDGEIDLYAESVESDFSTEEIQNVEF